MWLPQPRHHTWKGESHHNTCILNIFQVSLSIHFLSLTVRGGRGLRGPTCPHSHTEQEMSPNWRQSQLKSGPMSWVPHRTDSHPVSRWIGEWIPWDNACKAASGGPAAAYTYQAFFPSKLLGTHYGPGYLLGTGGQNPINPHHILKDSVIQRSEVCVDSKWSTI